ncbi:MAG: TolC family protein [Parasphingorhabdus sp.]|uniref:TolC family protein n=1 Tax=Parasphingorhabdus sp. TaxID=2709688 RepID=UPI0030022740
MIEKGMMKNRQKTRRAKSGLPLLVLPVLALQVPIFSLHAEPLTFAKAVELAETATPAIEARSLVVEAAQSAAIAADQLPDPKLSVDILDRRIAGPFEFSPRPGRNGFPRQRIGISQDIPNGAKRRARAGQAMADITVARANKKALVQDVQLYSALSWIDLHYAQRRLRILEVLQQSLNDVSATVGARLESGVTRPAEAFEPELLIAKLADRRSMRVADIEKARAMLARWTGVDSPETEGALPDFTLDREVLVDTIKELPILDIQDAKVERADADVELARANKRPDFSVNASYAHRRPEYGEYVSVGVTIDLPLFAKKRQNPVIDARILEASAARLEANDLERQLQAELSRDLAENRSYRENWERSKNILLPLAKKQAELERVSYGAGRVDLDTALNAAVAFAEAEIDLLDREATLVRDTVRIKYTYERNQP